jgi:NAD(P)H-dependent FMN reductase
MAEALTIALIVGTTRPGRQSIKAARYIEKVGQTLPNVKLIFVDPTELNLPLDGNDEENKDPRYTAITAEADAFFIVSPEYNHSFPGSLKRLLDSELKNYSHKPVAFAGVSSGPWGGVRAIEALVHTVRKMGMVPTLADVHFPNVESLFNDQEEMTDPKYEDRVKRSFAELIWMAEVLKWGRANIIK